ncbi:MAG: hypothetical protein H5T84_05365, partial [Thermoleophilia bacterium]|nr:hypothetical protein [Thermoleophilia bacterium]
MAAISNVTTTSSLTACSEGSWSREARGLPDTMRKVLVWGASRSGLAAARVLCCLGKQVLICDRKEPALLAGLEALLALGASFVPEAELDKHLAAVDLVIKSPGIPADLPLLRLVRSRGILVWSEIELAYVLLPNSIDAITGTNGKTTTTALLGHLFLSAGRPARVLGNIGVAACSAVGNVDPDEELVVEVSSFQLEDVHTFRPACAVFLNLTPDHLDRHGSMEE